jgi:hypothetical protein
MRRAGARLTFLPPRPALLRRALAAGPTHGGLNMRGYSVAALSISLIVPSILPARSDESPTLDVRPVCRGIASQSSDTLSAGLMKDSFEECVKSEQEVRNQVKEKWSSFSAADKKHCVALATTGGESSYTELLTCLEMSRDVRALRQAAAAPTTSTAKEPVSLPPASTMRPAASEKASPPSPLQEPLDRTRPAPPGKDSQATPTGKDAQAAVAKESAIADQIKKDAEQAKSEAQAAKASEAIAQRKLADAEAALLRAKEESRRMIAEAERSKADAKAARDAEDTLKRKLSDAEAARTAAEGREQACQTAAKTQTGIRARLRSWFGPKETNPKNP